MEHSTPKVVVTGFIAAVTFSLPAFTNAAEQVTIEELATRHAAAVQALIPFQCRVKYTDDRPSVLTGSCVSTGFYARSDDTTRGYRRNGFLQTDSIKRGGQSRGWMRNTKLTDPKAVNGNLDVANDSTVECDVWSYALFTLSDGHRRPLSDWLRSGAGVKIHNDGIEGRRLVRATVPANKTDFAIWFDPAVNYLARTVEVRTDAGGEFRFEVPDFAEVGPGIFCPKGVRLTGTKPGDPGPYGYTVEFSDISAGKPLPADAFAFKFPPGSMVNDTHRGHCEEGRRQRRPDAAGKNRLGKCFEVGYRQVDHPFPRATRAVRGTPDGHGRGADAAESLATLGGVTADRLGWGHLDGSPVSAID